MSPEILLIDDDPLASALRKRVLERQGYRVQIALDGVSGVALADVLNPALIIMDHRIPGLMGSELLQRLRAVRATTPVLVLSGYEYLRDQYPAPPSAFLTKGDGVEQMLRTISEHLA